LTLTEQIINYFAAHQTAPDYKPVTIRELVDELKADPYQIYDALEALPNVKEDKPAKYWLLPF